MLSVNFFLGLSKDTVFEKQFCILVTATITV